MRRARGVDVSQVQGQIDYHRLAAGDGMGVYDFLIPKCSEGGRYIDPKFLTHLTGARDAGMLVPLAYHVISPLATVENQVSLAMRYTELNQVDIALDFETGLKTMSHEILITRAIEFTEACQSRGRRVVCYSYPDFMRQLADSPKTQSLLEQLATITEYWSASYPDEKHEPKELANPWTPPAYATRWLFWQWSGNGGNTAPGIPQVVDHNVFNGTREDLQKWIQRQDYVMPNAC